MHILSCRTVNETVIEATVCVIVCVPVYVCICKGMSMSGCVCVCMSKCVCVCPCERERESLLAGALAEHPLAIELCYRRLMEPLQAVRAL